MKARIPSLVNLALLLALAAVCTYWVLQLTAARKPPEPLVAIASGDRVARTEPVDTAAAAALFGATGANAPSRIRLTGIIAEASKGAGVALLSLDGQPATPYRAGESIDDDTTLVEVRGNGIVIRSAQGLRELAMPERTAPGGITSVR
ncbi:MAG TPA: type II secretion system protein N [Burkholderiales bacterium]|nr:type II secretion system protein N [Burkholderiales bacterium]